MNLFGKAITSIAKPAKPKIMININIFQPHHSFVTLVEVLMEDMLTLIQSHRATGENQEVHNSLFWLRTVFFLFAALGTAILWLLLWETLVAPSNPKRIKNTLS